ncbi:putative phage tail protein [Paenibacillus agricola]|uniref:YmfQ family protein n=1 Tax=Paenibacillus agricola TaxID=2716264 RepID=A0ABX0JAZ5_9BACL|nr:putative phage tail protein [Paenibacillus agricola]NHN31121.1 YmfQ family protein [Paenibacillus agricola]
MRTYEIIRADMGGYLPLYYADSAAVKNLLDRESTEVAALNADIYGVLAQFSIDTATWGLTYWERVLGIVTDESKPIGQRRGVIKSLLRGQGTVTAESLRNVAESFVNGTVEIIEQNTRGTVLVRFIDERGVPANLADVKRAIKEIIPAHLRVIFGFTYVSWADIEARGMTFNTLGGYTWDGLQPLFSLPWAELDDASMTWSEIGVYRWDEIQAVSL